MSCQTSRRRCSTPLVTDHATRGTPPPWALPRFGRELAFVGGEAGRTSRTVASPGLATAPSPVLSNPPWQPVFTPPPGRQPPRESTELACGHVPHASPVWPEQDRRSRTVCPVHHMRTHIHTYIHTHEHFPSAPFRLTRCDHHHAVARLGEPRAAIVSCADLKLRYRAGRPLRSLHHQCE